MMRWLLAAGVGLAALGALWLVGSYVALVAFFYMDDEATAREHHHEGGRPRGRATRKGVSL